MVACISQRDLEKRSKSNQGTFHEAMSQKLQLHGRYLDYSLISFSKSLWEIHVTMFILLLNYIDHTEYVLKFKVGFKS